MHEAVHFCFPPIFACSFAPRPHPPLRLIARRPKEGAGGRDVWISIDLHSIDLQVAAPSNEEPRCLEYHGIIWARYGVIFPLFTDVPGLNKRSSILWRLLESMQTSKSYNSLPSVLRTRRLHKTRSLRATNLTLACLPRTSCNNQHQPARMLPRQNAPNSDTNVTRQHDTQLPPM